MNKYKVSQTMWTIVRAKDEDEARFKHQQLLDEPECWTEWEIELVEGQCDGVEDYVEENEIKQTKEIKNAKLDI